MEQTTHEEIPHHPPRRGEPEEPGFTSKVQVQRNRLQVLNQNTSVALDNGFRNTGGTRGVQDPKRMIEGHRRKGQRNILAKQLIPVNDVGLFLRGLPSIEIRDVHDRLQRR